MTNEKERFEILMEDMEKKFDAVIEGLISLREDFKEMRKIVAHQQEKITGHELRIKALEHEVV